MLLAILYIYQNTASTDFLYLSLTDINLDYQKILWLAFFISFSVKTPLFPFHI
jgi:NADH-ubiquinone oxidoreductase chain 4